MRLSKIGDLVRASGYEALFLLAGAGAFAGRPTARNLVHVENVLTGLRERRDFSGLVGRGLIDAGASGTKDALRLTELGLTVFEGGRRPEESWERNWDGDWRVLAFDLPMNVNEVRLRFWRWLRANHFGKLQGSVWIAPDPVPSIEKMAKKTGFDPAAVVVFTGRVAAGQEPREIAAKAWDFGAIDAGYRQYRNFAGDSLRKIRRESPPSDDLREILREDRRLWLRSVRRDPLLPGSLLPSKYEGKRAWKDRGKLHKTLFREFELQKSL